MPVEIGVDSYVTVEEADDYFSAHFGYGDWPILTEEQKSQALRSGRAKLDGLCSWYGNKCDPDQPLAFPRTNLCLEIPLNVKDAQCEITYLIIITGTAVQTTEDVLTGLKAGSVELTFKGALSPSLDKFVSSAIIGLLSDYGLCMGTGSTKVIPIQRA